MWPPQWKSHLLSRSSWAQVWTRVGKRMGGGEGRRLGRREHTPLHAPGHPPPRCAQMWPCPSCSKASRYHRDDSDMEQGQGCCPCMGCAPLLLIPQLAQDRQGSSPSPAQQDPWGPVSSKEALDLGFAMWRITPHLQVRIGPTAFIKWLLCLRNDSCHYFRRRRFKLWRHNEFWRVFCAVSNCLISRSWSH